MQRNSRSADPTICARCHQRGTGCCKLLPGTEALLFGLTPTECSAIASHTGENIDTFTQSDIAPPGFVEALRRIHPAFALTMPQGRRTHLRIAEGGCHFLGQSGCRLPEPV